MEEFSRPEDEKEKEYEEVKDAGDEKKEENALPLLEPLMNDYLLKHNEEWEDEDYFPEGQEEYVWMMNSEERFSESNHKNIFSMSHLIRNRYSLTQLIGKGTYGRVYECIDEQEAGMKKVIKESVFGNDDEFDPFENVFNLEVAVYKALAESPHSKFFPKFFESFVLEDPRKGYLVIEKVGYPVRMIRKQNLDNCFSFTNTAKISMSVAKGLKYLHECGYLHRDIQENNVVFSRDTNSEVVCKIIDFGTAQEIYNADGTINFEYPDMDFTNCSFSSLALNYMLPPDEQDDWESFFYFVLAIFNRFNLYGGPEELIEEKTKLHLDPISTLDDGFLVQLWLSIVGQGYRKKFNPDEVLEVLTDLGVDFEQPLDSEQVGYYFIVE